ncbi:malonyl-CoA-acyl carrier protein transacylase, mitochondrial-like [Hydractinia symbiolongicarpus]|uniref:malonyl-CoA-acyl carrier protein transacylase, mitochondrial-like n=1 Tax=Hydractinia symbiolongicarpus TaxID=13093 RepID=UPI00254C0768|nr:malonyl-CoA-acyl carrier protein transacylase, mitochondrial-like [Hydractinia symbiolongicarpus]XP_057292261.1 malonyl-CoA-acyl carrier protein transacylase, mitochondrial-like [Hydractinia symbiolongicarpus]XP_057292262.1 malonyl-CoA-acyl carrier protein transacylase, mitochondrial-like [Hydractinia symbiolongicarpus]
MKGIVLAASKAKCLLKAPGLRNYVPVTKTAPLPTFRGEKTAILCPGQGAQYVGMLQNLSPDIEEPLREMTSEILGYDLVKICRNGPKEILDRTLYTQPAVMVASILGYYKLKNKLREEHDVEDFNAGFVFGNSVGEVSALCIANWITFEEALQVIKVRAESMDRAVNMAESAMVGVHGLDFDDVKQMCEDLTENAGDKNKHISIAVERFYKSVALGGSKDLVEKVLNREHFLLKNPSKVKISKMFMSAAFHTPYMNPAIEEFYDALCSVNITPNDTTLVSNVTAQKYTNKEEVAELMARQIAEPVLWNTILDKVRGKYLSGSVENIYEVGAGRQLKRMYEKLDRDLFSNVQTVDM